jgi:hypothetical protein
MQQLNLVAHLEKALDTEGQAHQWRVAALQLFYQPAEQKNEYGQNVFLLLVILAAST